jgi:hypothetical protein
VFGVFEAETPIATAHALHKLQDRVRNVRESFKELCRQLAKPHHNIAVRKKIVDIVNHTDILYVCMTFSTLGKCCGQGTYHFAFENSYGIVG